MEHDQEMHAHSGDDTFTIYPPSLHPYSTSPTSFMIHSGPHLSSDTFGAPHRRDQHEADHVYDSPQLTLDPSTLDLRSNSNQEPRPSSANTGGSNSTTPTGSLRLSAYNLPNLSSGVTTRRRTRAALEQLQVPIQVDEHSEHHVQSPHQHTHEGQHHDDHQRQHQQSDMHDVHMQSGEMQMHVDDGRNHGLIGSGMGHGQGQNDTLSQHMFGLLPDASSHPEYYLHSDTFPHSPASASTPPEASSHPDLQPNSPASAITSSSPSSVSLSRTFRPSSHGLGISASRSLPLVSLPSAHGSPGQQQMSPSHGQPLHLSTHPHMHPSPYYPMSHNAGSPAFPSTPTTSHHTQGSSSSSHSSGNTRYSFRGSPGPRFGRGHTRSSSYGTVSTVSVRSSSPASSVTSAFTSLSGGAGSAPGSTSGPVGSPITFGDSGDVQMPFANGPPRGDGCLDSDNQQVRAQSHPPLSMPTAHPAMGAYSALLPQSGKGVHQQGVRAFMTGGVMEDSRESMWQPHVPNIGYLSPSSGPRMAQDGTHAQFPTKPAVTRTPHRKQKLANSDRKAICLYAKQHPSARQEDIAARYNVERSTISKILKNKERWLGCPDDDAKVARKRKPRFDDLELVLKQWVEGMKPQGILLSDALIRSKAKEEARRLGIMEDKFKASSGWLENFKHRVGIRKGKYIGREPWPDASDSEGDETSLSAKHVNDQKMVWQPDPSSSSEHAGKEACQELTTESQTDDAGEAKESDAPPSSSQTMSDQTAIAQPVTSASDQNKDPSFNPAAPVQLQTSIDRTPSRQEGGRVGVGMRKTRSRTLAEAREAEAHLPNGLTSPVTVSPTVATVAGTSSSAEHEPNSLGVVHNSLARSSHVSSPSSNSPTIAVLSDGREASAGLDAAIDFIGSQPHGFATPEEVAVLKKLSRRMSRAELPRHHHSTSSIPTGWSGSGET